MKSLGRFITICILTFLGIFSLCYCSAKFYDQKFLLLEMSPNIVWVIVFTILLGLLLLGLYNAYIVQKLTIENIGLKDLINKNSEIILESIYNNRDVGLDTYNYLTKDDKLEVEEGDN